MNLIEIIISGVIQGFTEFLPVSSSGHLVIFQNILKINQPGITMNIFLHTGTLLSVIVVFRKDIMKLITGFFKTFKKEKTDYGKLSWLILAANIPAGVVGILFRDNIEKIFTSSYSVYIFLIITGLFLFISKFCRNDKLDIKNLTLLKSLIIGIGQMAAILPGISRSGITITTGLLLKLKREDAVKFSFFIMLIAVAGATGLEITKLDMASINIAELITGIFISFITGYIAIKILLRIVRSYKLHYFSYYCISVGIIGILLS